VGVLEVVVVLELDQLGVSCLERVEQSGLVGDLETQLLALVGDQLGAHLVLGSFESDLDVRAT
jgi:hypothetical protein